MEEKLPQSFRSKPQTIKSVKKEVEVLQSYRKFCSVPVDPSLYSAIKIGKKMPRVKSPNPDQPLLLRDKEVLRVHRTLPAYMHNQGTRLGAAHAN